MPRRLVSLCIPVLNEEMNLRRLLEEIARVVAPLSDHYDFEFVFTDNHSTDRTFELLAEFARADRRIRVIRFSRNFGFQRSVLTAFREARGDCAIQLDADLQDPPSLIPEFIAEWENGAKVVYGIRRRRHAESPLRHAQRRLFYRLINALSDDELPHDAGDFRLVDRVILDQLRASDDQNPYVRGQIAAMGFKQVGIPYDRASREAGETKFTFGRLAALAADGLFNHSLVPLRLATFAGMVLSALAVLGVAYYVLGRLFFRQDWPVGLASLSILILFLIGLNATFLGILGEYVGRIYLNSLGRPLVIVESRIDDADAPKRESQP